MKINIPKGELTPFGKGCLISLPIVAVILFWLGWSVWNSFQTPTTVPPTATATTAATTTVRPNTSATATQAPTATIRPTVPVGTTATIATPVVSSTAIPVATTAATPIATIVPTPASKLAKVQVGVVVYAPYATAIGASEYAAKYGVEIEIVNLTGREADQCGWVRGEIDPPPAGVSRILLTTHNSAFVCVATKAVAIVDQSAGADAIVCREEITSWNLALAARSTGTGSFSVSEYLIRSFAWAMGKEINFVAETDAEPAMNRWASDATIKCVVLWQPYIDMALDKVKGAKVVLSTKTWAGILDVAVIKDVAEYSTPIEGALAAWYEFLNLEFENKNQAWKILESWQSAHQENGALGYDKAEDFFADLGNVAQATLANNGQLLIDDQSVVVQRFKEVASVIATAGVVGKDGKPFVYSNNPSNMIDGRYIAKLRGLPQLQTTAKPSNTNLNTSALPALNASLEGAVEKIIGGLADAHLSFAEDSTEFADPKAARKFAEDNILPIIRLTSDVSVQIMGGYAMPGGCKDCTDAYGVDLAKRRAQAFKDFLVAEFKITADRILLSKEIRPPEYRGTYDTTKQKSDRRIQLFLVSRGGY